MVEIEMAYKRFLGNCIDAGIDLHDSLQVKEPSAYSKFCSYLPGSWFTAIAITGELLNGLDRIEPLASGPIPLDCLASNPATEQRVLRNIINGSITPETSPTQPAFQNIYEGGVDVCRSAEGRFGTIFNEMRKPDNPAPRGPSGNSLEWTFVVDGSSPVLLEKTRGAGRSSTLALEDITINGIPYPAGSLLAIYKLPHARLSAGAHTVVPMEEVENVSFMRLSAYTLPPGRREIFDNNYKGETTWPMEQLREVAHTALADVLSKPSLDFLTVNA